MSKLYVFDTKALSQKRRSVTRGIKIFMVNSKPLQLVQPCTFWEWEHDLFKTSYKKFFYRQKNVKVYNFGE